MPKKYLSTLSDQWTLERQRALLGVGGSVYQDTIAKAARTRMRDAKEPGERDKVLKDRAALLRPSSRQAPDTVEVASLVCLAVNTADFFDVVARASAKGLTILARDTGRQITPGQGTEEVAREAPLFAAALRKRQLRSAPEYAAAMEAEARARAKSVEHLWRLPNREAPLDMIRAKAGRDGRPMAPATLIKHLGKRREAQRIYKAGLKRSATAAAKRKEQEDAE